MQKSARYQNQGRLGISHMKKLGTAEEWIEGRLTLSHCLKLELTLKERAR